MDLFSEALTPKICKPWGQTMKANSRRFNRLSAVVTAIALCAPLSGGTQPVTVTAPASSMLNGTATLNGMVNPLGADTTAWFEWGTSTNYGQPTAPANAGSGADVVPVSAALSNLTQGLTYHYRCVASNSLTVVRGSDRPFWTPVITLNGPNPLTNECHVPFVDPQAAASARLLAIAAGSRHRLALKADGSVAGWGDNFYGQINIPAAATNVMTIAAGGRHSLALKADGAVIGWGANDYGQITIPASATNIVAIAAGDAHSLALRSDGSVVGWGTNNYGQITIPANATNIVTVAAYAAHSMALKADGTVIAWGDFGYYMPASVTNVVAIAAGGYHSLALKADGSVVGWGDNFYGQITIPVSATDIVAIAAGRGHSLALKADGTVIAWGQNDAGQTGISYSTSVIAIAAGSYFSLALKADSTVKDVGYNFVVQTTIPADLNHLNLPLTVTGTVDVNNPGTYSLSYSVTNSLGAVAIAFRTVIVKDTLPPVITLLGSDPILHVMGTPFVDPGATATDLCAGDLATSIQVTGSVDVNVPGSYQIHYNVSDAYGHPAEAIRTVVVGRPLVTTLPATGLLNDTATLNGTVNPQGANTTAWLEWGTTKAYGNRTSPQSIGNGTNAVAMNAVLSSLTPGVIYHYRCMASNSGWVIPGANQTFCLLPLTLKGPSPLTNECHVSFNDPRATISRPLLAVAAGGFDSLALRVDGTVVT